MDIGSGNTYPACALSNFAPHPFEIDGIPCNSMEGFLQALKFKSEDMQKEVCLLVGAKAKFKGKHKNWYRTQTLWWKGQEIDRHSNEYQNLLDRAFGELAKNTEFRKALLATQNANLTHSIGKRDPHKTILTTQEFCSRLMRLREQMKKDKALF
jgi:predicted NAD-dependent protein-ADP-ribosyltransferase YbiA (DUF1768 family)